MAQVNPTVGDPKATATYRRLHPSRRRRSAPVVFPEMVLTGYPVEDLASAALVDASITALHALARRLADTGLGDLPSPSAT